jgi:hypothetical protein
MVQERERMIDSDDESGGMGPQRAASSAPAVEASSSPFAGPDPHARTVPGPSVAGPPPGMVPPQPPVVRRKLPPVPGFSGSFVPGFGKPTNEVENYVVDAMNYVRSRKADLDANGISQEYFVTQLTDQLTGPAKEWHRQLLKRVLIHGETEPRLSLPSGL